MTVKLLRDTRITHKAGDIVEVSPAEAGFLLEVGSAEAVKKDEPKEEPKRAGRKKK